MPFLADDSDPRRSDGLKAWEVLRSSHDGLWIFGYGSLVWRPDFPRPHDREVVGRISGYYRRFWQGSTDHRGVPGAPGRVVTLVPDKEGHTWGVAYHFAEEHVEDVLLYLDHREKGGYTSALASFEPRDKSPAPFQVLLYTATEENEEYLGPASDEEIASQIAASVGPSGPNNQYLFRLAEAIRRIAPESENEDLHLFGLEKLVMERQRTNGLHSGS